MVSQEAQAMNDGFQLHLRKLEELATTRQQMIKGSCTANHPSLLRAIAYNIACLTKYRADDTAGRALIDRIAQLTTAFEKKHEGINGISSQSIEELDKLLAGHVLQYSGRMYGTELPYWTSLRMKVPESCEYTSRQLDNLILFGLQREEERAKANLENLTSKR